MDPFPDAPPRPQNVGILAMEVYFPRFFVAQSDLERYNGVPAGKYTLGLGQDAMAFTGDREDVNSIALTCVAGLLEKYAIDPRDVGRLEVGTETLVDKSKSTKTVLMQLFAASGNSNVEGASTINACYGATAAVLNAIDWVESSAWDGRYAIVVAADIAVYAKGAARPTGGCGGVAMLIGPDAPLAIDSRTRVTSAAHVWDFYKPELTSEYPTVDGALSQTCYIQALDDCYLRLCTKTEQLQTPKSQTLTTPTQAFSVDSVDYVVFHSPYNKLVQKSFARLVFLDAWRRANSSSSSSSSDADAKTHATLAKWLARPLDETLVDRELDLATRAVAGDGYARKVAPGCTTAKRIGNAYTGAVYINLATLVHARGAALDGARVLLFSYGSGRLASMFTVRGRTPSRSDSQFTLARIAATLSLDTRLAAREQVSAEQYAVYMDVRERVFGRAGVTPIQPAATIAPGAFYLEGIDATYHRTYARQLPVTESEPETAKTAETAEPPVVAPPAPVMTPTRTAWDRAGAPYVAGVSALLPGASDDTDAAQRLERLLTGANCIAPLSDDAVASMLARNVVHNGERVTTRAQSVQVAAVAPCVDLVAQYGVAASLVAAMDDATQLAVAAGLDALEAAGLASRPHWRLADAVQPTLGVVYATSFPTTHAALAQAARSHADASAEFDRKLLLRLLVLANAQLAQLTGARGPNTQVNAACAGTTQALGVAHDWLALGKCARVLVVASDVASSEALLPWIAGGFRALGAASTAARVEDAARPFDVRRNGLVLGAGAVALVLEAPAAFAARCPRALVLDAPPRVRLLAARFSNSAFHGASLDPTHVAEELVRFLLAVERDCGVSRAQIAQHGVYYSHETSTNASPTASCAYAEVTALRAAFGEELLGQLLVANTKGATGHAMGVAFEDVAAVAGLRAGRVPGVANFEHADPHLGSPPLRLAPGGAHAHRYALRFAAGFGSQLAFALFALEQ